MVAITKSQPTQSTNDTDAEENVTSTSSRDCSSQLAQEDTDTIVEADAQTLSTSTQIDMRGNHESCESTEENTSANEIRSNHIAPSHLPTCETAPSASSTACTLPDRTIESQLSSTELNTVPEGTNGLTNNVTRQYTLVTSEHNEANREDLSCTLQEDVMQSEIHAHEVPVLNATDHESFKVEAVKDEAVCKRKMENTYGEMEVQKAISTAENSKESEDQYLKSPNGNSTAFKNESEELTTDSHQNDTGKIDVPNCSEVEKENVKVENDKVSAQESTDPIKNEQISDQTMGNHTNASILTLETISVKENESLEPESDHETPTSPLVSPPLSQDTDAVSLENFETEDLEQANNESPFSNVSEELLTSNSGATITSCSTSESFDQARSMEKQLVQDPSTTVSYPGGRAPNLIAMSAPTPIRPLHGDPRYGSHYTARSAPQEAPLHHHKEFYHPSQPPTTYAPMNTVQFSQVPMRNMDTSRMFENQRNAPSFYNPSQDAPPLIQSHMNHQGNVSNGMYDPSRNTAEPLPSIPNQNTSQPAPNIPYSQPQVHAAPFSRNSYTHIFHAGILR